MPTEYLSGEDQPFVIGPSAEALATPNSSEMKLNPLYVALGLLAVFMLYKKV